MNIITFYNRVQDFRDIIEKSMLQMQSDIIEKFSGIAYTKENIMEIKIFIRNFLFNMSEEMFNKKYSVDFKFDAFYDDSYYSRTLKVELSIYDIITRINQQPISIKISL